MANKFKPKDVVRLRSGSDDMVIYAMSEYPDGTKMDDDYKVTWHDKKGKDQKGHYKEDALEMVKQAED